MHRYPELSFKEIQTSERVAAELRALPGNIEVKDGIVTEIPGTAIPEEGKPAECTKTGVVGILRNGDGPIVMYRADMDALPVVEEKPAATGDYVVSDVEGVMHACGHDAHVTWMLGAAKILASHPDWWSGTLVLLAQPAEELLLGAKAMCDAGLYDERFAVPVPDSLIALHTAPVPTGWVVHGGGLRQAGSDQFDVTFHGVGGHGSQPHATKDPVVMAALAVVQYQLIVSRTIDPQQAAVLTVGAIHAGTANNIIPAEATVKINTRFFSEETQGHLLEGVKSVSTSIAQAYGITGDNLPLPTISLAGSVAPMVNDDDLVGKIAPYLDALPLPWVDVNKPDKKLLVLDDIPPTMGSEDCPELIPLDGNKKGRGTGLYDGRHGEPGPFRQSRRIPM